VSPVRYELDFYIQEDGILIVAAMKTSNLTMSTINLRFTPIKSITVFIFGGRNYVRPGDGGITFLRNTLRNLPH
jgi:hypothetical protein